jgi:tyrosyl-tRNA synthetase
VTTAFDVLESRGLIHQVTDEEAVRAAFASPGVSIYAGFDPTDPSLHIGNLLPIMVLAQLQRAGHRPICLVGGATGMIGDPSGRDVERELLTAETVARNAAAIARQLERFLRFEGPHAALLVDNRDWTAALGFVDFLRDVGKHFSVNTMLAKESVKRRLDGPGISYTEFSYSLIQAHDFLHLYEKYGCTMQVGGSDQWGNITAGVDLVRRKHGIAVQGITHPLITTASGAKLSKSSGNAPWLDAERTSPYEFYQYWIRTDDRDVERFLKLFTFLELSEIESVCAEHRGDPEKRAAQRRLAAELTRLVHGEEPLRKAEGASRVLFGEAISGLSDAELLGIFPDVPSTRMERARLEAGIPVIDLLAESGVCKSKGEARRLVKNGGAYLNNQRLADPDARVELGQLASESLLVIRKGKKSYHLVRFE